MRIHCVWEHSGEDTLLWAGNLPGVCARGAGLEEALEKLPREAACFLRWQGRAVPEELVPVVVQEKASTLQVRDADSDVLFDSETGPLAREEYEALRELCLRSAGDFLALYRSVPDPDRSVLPARETFYGPVPRTAREMYEHTKNVNSYYFGEIGVEADDGGSILDCRRRGFALLEAGAGFLDNPVREGSYGESWSLKKLLRRFLWHDRIHARAMYRMAARTFGCGGPRPGFCFEDR